MDSAISDGVKMDDITDNIALHDLDGTLADYDKGMRDAYLNLCSPQELYEMEPYFNPSDARHGHVAARTRMIRSMPGWWRNLARYQPGFDVLDVCREVGFNNHILTKGPRSLPHAWGEKVEWAQAEVPDNAGIHISQEKSLIYGKVLSDDWPAYYGPWLKARPRGLVIVCAHPWNEGKTDHPNIVRYDGTNLDEVRERIIEQRTTVTA